MGAYGRLGVWALLWWMAGGLGCSNGAIQDRQEEELQSSEDAAVEEEELQSTEDGAVELESITQEDGGIAEEETNPPCVDPSGCPKRPFPQQEIWPGAIRPSQPSQAGMNSAVANVYEDWKTAYLRSSNGATPGGGYFIEMRGTGGSGKEKTTSEAHGYGMIIFALMAGYDPEAKTIFDGMFNMTIQHPSTIDSDLMSWIIDESEQTTKDSDSATDGDLDIAYALLLAHSQWGSAGSIDYQAQALRIIADGIRASEMNPTTYRTRLGDWDDDPYNSRPSDWMTDHFAAFQVATQDAFWGQALTTVYSLVEGLVSSHAPTTGLLPDFVVDQVARPAPPGFLEAPTDGDFSWNACRVPLRLAVDLAHRGRPEAKQALSRMLAWAAQETSQDPGQLKAGYTLAGQALGNYEDLAFTAPMVAGAICDPLYQDFLDKGFALMAGARQDYFGDSLNLLSLLLISGNWWCPN